MEKKQTGRSVQGKVTILWPKGRNEGAEVQFALVSHILGWTCSSLSFWKEHRGGS